MEASCCSKFGRRMHRSRVGNSANALALLEVAILTTAATNHASSSPTILCTAFSFKSDVLVSDRASRTRLFISAVIGSSSSTLPSAQTPVECSLRIYNKASILLLYRNYVAELCGSALGGSGLP